jgi:hypothetical protein
LNILYLAFLGFSIFMQSPAKQSVLSSFFAKPSPTGSLKQKQLEKRGNSPIDLTLPDDENDNSELHPSKRRKLASSRAQTSVEPHTSRNASPSKTLPTSPTNLGSQRWRFDASASQASTSLPEPMDSERLKRRERLARSLVGDNSSLRGRKGESEDAIEEDDSSASERGSDDQFKQLQEMFSMKSKKKRALPDAKVSKGKEVGPSGKPFTPLEQQLR